MLYRTDNHMPVNLPKNTTDYQRAAVYEILCPSSHKDLNVKGFFSIESRAKEPLLQRKPRHGIN